MRPLRRPPAHPLAGSLLAGAGTDDQTGATMSSALGLLCSAQEAVAELVGETPLVDAWHRASGGNPFLLRALIDELEATGERDPERVLEPVARAVRRRLRALGDGRGGARPRARGARPGRPARPGGASGRGDGRRRPRPTRSPRSRCWRPGSSSSTRSCSARSTRRSRRTSASGCTCAPRPRSPSARAAPAASRARRRRAARGGVARGGTVGQRRDRRHLPGARARRAATRPRRRPARARPRRGNRPSAVRSAPPRGVGDHRLARHRARPRSRAGRLRRVARRRRRCSPPTSRTSGWRPSC